MPKCSIVKQINDVSGDICVGWGEGCVYGNRLRGHWAAYLIILTSHCCNFLEWILYDSVSKAFITTIKLMQYIVDNLTCMSIELFFPSLLAEKIVLTVRFHKVPEETKINKYYHSKLWFVVKTSSWTGNWERRHATDWIRMKIWIWVSIDELTLLTWLGNLGIS